MTPDFTVRITRTITVILASFVLLTLSLLPKAAGSAPQALALVATSTPVQLTCAGDKCSAEFTTFCLQAERFAPQPGTNYFPDREKPHCP